MRGWTRLYQDRTETSDTKSRNLAVAQHPVKNTWKFISCEHGIAESAKLKRGEIREGEWHGACLGREGGRRSQTRGWRKPRTQWSNSWRFACSTVRSTLGTQKRVPCAPMWESGHHCGGGQRHPGESQQIPFQNSQQ